MVILFVLFPSPIYAAEDTKQLIIVNKATNELAFYDDGELVHVFDVATGKQSEDTPEGIFVIVNKIKNRPYYKEKIPGGDPKNPLGDRWLGIDARNTYGTTYGIHGNNDESSIGKYISAGCIRMRNKEVRWLFEQVRNKTTVYITDSKKDFHTLAVEANYEVDAGKIEAVDVKLKLLEKTVLYSKPSKFFTTKLKLSPQNVTAFEKVRDWYHIKTWTGDAWIKSNKLLVGETKSASIELELQQKTSLYLSPLVDSRSVGALAPQKVKVFEQWGDWYHIRTWLGNVWIHIIKD
jgi:hypothetical protein